MRLRACDYINKPFDIATMRAAVSQAMQRRTLESEIHSSAEKVQELLTELQNQRIEEQIAKTRGDIYASIIHDINGPLTVISGFVQVLNQRLNRTSRLEMEDLEFIKDRLRIIARQVGNCIEISRRYLGFLRRQSDEHAPRVSVNQLLNDLEQLVRVHPSLQDNEFSITPLAEDIGVKINGTDLIQILLNLAVNAFQCAPQQHRVEIGGEVLRAPLDLTSIQGRPARPAAERRELGQHRAAGEILGARQRPRHSAGSAAENFPALFHHQRPAPGHRPGPQHRPAAHQGRPRRAARPHPTRRRHDLHDLSAGGEAGEITGTGSVGLEESSRTECVERGRTSASARSATRFPPVLRQHSNRFFSFTTQEMPCVGQNMGSEFEPLQRRYSLEKARITAPANTRKQEQRR